MIRYQDIEVYRVMGLISLLRVDKRIVAGYHYYFISLKDVYGLKAIDNIGNEDNLEAFFNNNSISFEQYIIENYGKDMLNNIPKGIIVGRKYIKEFLTIKNAFNISNYLSLGPLVEIITDINLGDITDEESKLLLYHGSYYEYGTDEKCFGIEKKGPWSIDKGFIAGRNKKKCYTSNDRDHIVLKFLSDYSEKQLVELIKLITEFSEQTIKSKEKYYINVIKMYDEVIRDNGIQLIRKRSI
jgi:hypothetical protein